MRRSSGLGYRFSIAMILVAAVVLVCIWLTWGLEPEEFVDQLGNSLRFMAFLMVLASVGPTLWVFWKKSRRNR